MNPADLPELRKSCSAPIKCAIEKKGTKKINREIHGKITPIAHLIGALHKGRADWPAIRMTKDAVSVPVIANGDIVDVKTARRALAESGADGVMVGRGAQGRPWLLAQIAHALYGTPAPVVPTGQALTELVSTHYEAVLGFYGTELGVRVARKHLGWYMDTPLRVVGCVARC